MPQQGRLLWLDEIASGAELTGLDQDGAADVSTVRWIGGRLNAVVLRTGSRSDPRMQEPCRAVALVTAPERR